MSSPIIFEKGTRDFSTLGLGLLSDAIQATTTEELNGQFIFEMDYPVSGNNADLIKENRIIVVNSGHILKRQGFIIRQIVRKIDLTMTVYAEHVSYATLDVALAPIGTISGDAKTALENWKRMLVPAVDFTVDSDILTTNSTSIGAPDFETARQGLGGHAGSILDVWGGEYQFDNWHIRLLKQRGKSANAIIAYGRNLISFEQDTNIADTYTSVYPYYQENSGDEGNKNHFLPERTVDSEFVGKYPNPKVLMLDLSNKFKDVADYSETKLRNYALSYIQSNNIGVPKVNMKISTVDLSRATGDFSEDIDLGDTVNVYFEKLGITTSAKIIKAVWNVLSDDYDKFEIGARRSSLTESISELATTADENANKALNQALVAQQSADGKTTIYYLNSSDPWPTNPKENDTAFVKDGENSIMYRYMFNNDTGVFSWVKILDSMSADQIKQRVSDSLESGKAYSDKLVADNVAQVNRTLSDVQAKQADLTAQQAELDTKAQGYANKALDNAKADTLATATQTAKDASDALAKAKTDLTTSLNKEVTDRANAVTALDTKAKGYADTAKADAISASTTADGVINKKIDDTASSITSTISQNKTDADGKITTAQSTATQALNGLATKVSQTVYDAKTGQLQTDLNTTTTTANTAKTDIVAIKSDNTKQDARMTTIESDANGVKTTVSNLQTDLGKANGSITTLQQRADGFDATVTKVNNLSVGGRNWLLDSKTAKSATGNNGTNQIVIGYGMASGMNSGKMVSDWGAGTYITLSFDWAVTGATVSGTFIPQFYPQPYAPLGSKITVSSTNTSGHYTGVKVVGADWAGTSAPTIDFRLDGFNGVFTVSNIKLEQGNMPTAYTPAPEDVDSATAKAQLTADQATTSLSNYRSDADSRISKAQADIIVNANAITQKVSQSDYNAKTGDLTTKVNTAQSTADSATSTIGAYKTANDARVASAESKITANATAITQKVSQTDYNTKTGQIDGQISTINQTAGQISQSVSNVKAQVDGLSVGGRNLLLDTGRVRTGTGTNTDNNGQDVFKYTLAGNRNTSTLQGLYGTGTAITISFDWEITGSTISGVFYPQWQSQPWGVGEGGASGITVSSTNTSGHYVWSSKIPATWANFTANVIGLRMNYLNGVLTLRNFKFETGNLATNWSPAPEDTDNKISTVSQTVDSISSIVSDPSTGLTKRVQTAEGTLSQVSGADIPALQKATYWQPYSSLDFNSYTKQGSFFFNTTSAKTNGPTSSTSWTYLMVEQGTADNGRIKQTAWYDGVTGVKITYVRTLNSGTWSPWYANDNDSVASIAQTNGAIQTEISNRATGDTNTLTQAKDFTTSSISNSESGMRSQITQTSDAILGKVGAVNLFPNSEFEKDYGYRTKNPGVTLSLDTKNQIGTQYNGTVNVAPTSAGWQGYWARNIEVQGGQKYSGSVLVHYTNGGVTGGNAVLDNWFIDKDGNRINQGTGGSRSIGTGQVSSPYWVKLYFEGVTAPDNAVNLQVSLLTNDKGVGQTAVFTQPMVTATEKLQPYVPNNDITTQLALLKDNWSIGIADNAGAITNGIVGNSTNMSLISNNVVINAPSTQIKGTAWINSAMIGNGQIGTAQIGDASITSAKIMNLDVNKITGNVSNWVLSQWTSATGNKVTIDGNGLYFSPGTSRMTADGFEAWRMDAGSYAAMGLVGSYAWQTNNDVNGMGLIAKFYDQPHTDANDPYRNERWGADTIAIGALAPETGNGYGYVAPFLLFPANDETGNRYFPNNGSDTILMGRWLSIYTGLNMRGKSILNSSGYSLKENFTPLAGTEALDIFDNTEIVTYDYKPDSDDLDERTLATMKNKVGFVINDNGESPFKTDPRLVRYGNTRDDSVTVGYLMSAVKELHAKVKELTTKLEAQK